jgi:sulfur-carrier protein
MALTVFITGHLKSFTDGEIEARLDESFGAVGEVLEAVWRRHPALRDRILNEQGEIRQHVNIFYDGKDVRRMEGLATPLGESREVHIFNAVSGG